MKLRLTVPFLLLCLFASVASAQTPQAEVFGGYSFLRANPGGGSPGVSVPAGWHASVAANVNDWFGLAGDFSGHYKSISGVNTSAHLFTFGPRFTKRSDIEILFAHVQVGGARLGAGFGPFSASDTAFAAVVGGGADLLLSERVSWRVGQFDYVLTRFGGNAQHNFRFSTGIVFRFGEK